MTMLQTADEPRVAWSGAPRPTPRALHARRPAVAPARPPAAPAAFAALGDRTLLSAVAHDLRGPLTALTNSSELLLEDFQSLDRGQIHGMVSAIHRRAVWLQGLVENVLCAATIREGRLAIQPRAMSLLSLVGEVQALLEPLMAQKRQTLRVRADAVLPDVLADGRRVGQVLVNLLVNASKFAERDTPIDVLLSSRAGCVRLTVADRGPGLPPGPPSRLFEPFYRGGSAGHAGKEGVGLGLSIVRSLVEAHGGRVGAARRRGGGAAFWFELPALPTLLRGPAAGEGPAAAEEA